MTPDSALITTTMESIEDRIAALIEREIKYTSKRRTFSRKVSNRDSPISIVRHHDDFAAFAIDDESRLLICDWMYRVVDYYSINREIIPIAMSYFDRYVAKNPRYCNKKEHCQLLAVTAMYTAIKLHDTEKGGSLLCFSKISNGRFSPKEIESMEKKLLNDLDWLMNPPTPQSFIYYFMDLLSTTISDEHARRAMSNIYEVANYIVEVALLRSPASNEKSSTLAFSSFIVAVSEAKRSVLSPKQYKYILSSILSFDFATPDEIATVVDEVKNTLESGNGHLQLAQVYEKFDPKGIVYQF